MRTRPLAVAVLAAVLLAGCDGSGTTSGAPARSGSAAAGSGEAHKTGTRVLDDAAAALTMAGAVHLVGTVVTQGKQMAMDLRLQGTDAIGTLSFDGNPVQVLVTGGRSYLRGSTAFWTAQGVPQRTALRLDNRWVIPPPGKSQLGLAITFDGLVQGLLQPTSGAKVRDGVTTDTLDGRPVVVVTTTDGKTLYVAAEGESYPLKLDITGPEPGTITLTEFGQRVTLPAVPTDALDFSQLGSA